MLFRDMLEKAGEELKDIVVHSVGVYAFPDQPASEQAIKVMEEKNINLGKHRSKSMTRESIEKADLILTMTARHKVIVLQMVPEAKNKVFTLNEYALEDMKDIMDPYGMSIDEYRKSSEEIREALEKLIGKVKNR